ncbi:MAG: C45 family peptidase [Lachnospiraceae bacterium]|nr:C45 family peptidase [Lachnospiraceae bacterium]
MKRNKKKTASMIATVILVIVIGVFIAGYAMFHEKLQAAQTVKKIDSLYAKDDAGNIMETKGEHEIYKMEYRGDYGFTAFLEQGGATDSDEMAKYITNFLSNGFYKKKVSASNERDFGCSTISAQSPTGNQLCGRNYDWEPCNAMIVHTVPKEGYESYSTVCLDFLGFGEDWKPEGLMNQYMSLAAIYVPLDGMNEMGLCVADLVAGNEIETHQQTEKADLTTTTAIRLLLDCAGNVEEAVDLLSQYDMNSDIGTAHHLSISDADGNSVVVEYVDEKMKVTETSVVTNHYLTEGKYYDVGSEQSHERYDLLTQNLRKSDGIMSLYEIKKNLSGVAQSNFSGNEEITVWSIVYDKTNLTIDYYFTEDYGRTDSFEIKR